MEVVHREIQGPQGRLSIYEVGRNDGSTPLLFLHADSGGASQWLEMLARFAGSRHAIALDFRGHGKSAPATNSDYTYSGRAEDVASAVAALSLERCIIIAHSAGAAVALQYALDHPQAVAGLMFVDPLVDPRSIPQAVRDGFVKDLNGPLSLDAQKQFFTSIVGDDAAVRERVLADSELVDPAARAGVGIAMANWAPDATLMAWKGLIFILATASNDHAGALYRLRPDVPHQVVTNAGHWVQLDRPDVVERAIREFVTSVDEQ